MDDDVLLVGGESVPNPVEVRILVGGDNPIATALLMIEMVQEKYGANLVMDVTLEEKRAGGIAFIDGGGVMGHFDAKRGIHPFPQPNSMRSGGSEVQILGASEGRAIVDLIVASFRCVEVPVYALGELGGEKLRSQVSVYGPPPHRSSHTLRQTARRYRGKNGKGR